MSVLETRGGVGKGVEGGGDNDNNNNSDNNDRLWHSDHMPSRCGGASPSAYATVKFRTSSRRVDLQSSSAIF